MLVLDGDSAICIGGKFGPRSELGAHAKMSNHLAHAFSAFQYADKFMMEGLQQLVAPTPLCQQ